MKQPELELLNKLEKESLRGLHDSPDFETKIKQLKSCTEIAQQLSEIQADKQIQVENLQESSQFKEFNQWLVSNGVTSEKVDYMFIPALKCNGVVCKVDLKQGETVFEVPKKCMIMQSHLFASKVWLDIHRSSRVLQNAPHLMLALALLSEKFLGQASAFKAYLDILPTDFPSLPMFWSVADMEMLKNTTAQSAAIDRRFNCWSYYCHLTKLFEDATKELKPSRLPVLLRKRENLTLSMFTWALCITMTRQNRIPVSSTKSANSRSNVTQELALIPVFDMCNHQPGIYTSAYNMKTETLDCEASRDYKAGEEYRIFYGARPDSDLLVYSGFVMPPGENEYNSFALNLTLPSKEEDPLYGIKKLLLSKCIHPSKKSLKLGKGPFYNEDIELALKFARISCLTKEEASEALKSSQIEFSTPFNSRNEEAAKKFLKERIDQIKVEKKVVMDDFKKKWGSQSGNGNDAYNMVLSLHEGEYDCLDVTLPETKTE